MGAPLHRHLITSSKHMKSATSTMPQPSAQATEPLFTASSFKEYFWGPNNDYNWSTGLTQRLRPLCDRDELTGWSLERKSNRIAFFAPSDDICAVLLHLLMPVYIGASILDPAAERLQRPLIPIEAVGKFFDSTKICATLAAERCPSGYSHDCGADVQACHTRFVIGAPDTVSVAKWLWTELGCFNLFVVKSITLQEEQCLPANTPPWESILQAMSDLREGWFDGSGVPPKQEIIEITRSVLGLLNDVMADDEQVRFFHPPTYLDNMFKQHLSMLSDLSFFLCYC